MFYLQRGDMGRLFYLRRRGMGCSPGALCLSACLPAEGPDESAGTPCPDGKHPSEGQHVKRRGQRRVILGAKERYWPGQMGFKPDEHLSSSPVGEDVSSAEIFFCMYQQVDADRKYIGNIGNTGNIMVIVTVASLKGSMLLAGLVLHFNFMFFVCELYKYDLIHFS